ncbi:hypothetical protein PG988_015509 [Apiospora saccharicola]
MIAKRLSVSNCIVPLLLGLLPVTQIVFAGVVPPQQDLNALLTDPARQWGKGTIVSLGGSAHFKNVTERWTIFNPPPTLPPSVRRQKKTLGRRNGQRLVPQLHRRHPRRGRRPLHRGARPGDRRADLGAAGDLGRAAPDRVAESYPDLFWAVRGAGANFGAVVSATYQLHPLRNHGDILTADFYYPANRSAAYFRAVESFNGRLPAEMASLSRRQLGLPRPRVRRPPGPGALPRGRPFVPEHQRGEVEPAGGGGGRGLEEQICRGGQYRDLHSLNIRNYSAAAYSSAFAKMDRYFRRYPEGRESNLAMEFFPNRAMKAVPRGRRLGLGATPRATCKQILFPRHPPFAPLFATVRVYVCVCVCVCRLTLPLSLARNPNMLWTAEAAGTETARAASALGAELRRDLQASDGYPEPAVFVNYARGDEALEGVYARENLPRLARLKKQWDPHGVFSYNLGLPDRYP